jgi:hypothetical protein
LTFLPAAAPALLPLQGLKKKPKAVKKPKAEGEKKAAKPKSDKPKKPKAKKEKKEGECLVLLLCWTACDQASCCMCAVTVCVTCALGGHILSSSAISVICYDVLHT